MSGLESEITHLLSAWGDGDQEAFERLVPLIQADLRRVASRCLRAERPGHSLAVSGLLNEAYLRLLVWRPKEWQNRAHFFAVAAKMMRRILVNHAIERQRAKRGGAAIHVTLSDAVPVSEAPKVEILALHQALERLGSKDQLKMQIVELRFFGGLNEEEIASVMSVPLRTVQREWNFARAWLHRELSAPPMAAAQR
jgi:RNA polymerase sigma factor (TIGR02999 family)